MTTDPTPTALGLDAEDREALVALLIENRSRAHPISAYLFDPHDMADAILVAGWRSPEHVAAAKAEAAEISRYAPRFWRRVEVGSRSECWPWIGPTLHFGHGRYDSPAGKVAHRFAWATSNGRIPTSEEVVRHRCDNPPCCNPDHLDIGSQRDNVDDMIDRGRASFTRETCRNGHPRSAANLIIKSNGERRCKTCEREREAVRRAAAPRYECPVCGLGSKVYNLVRHLRAAHGETWTPAEVRDRANRYEAAQNASAPISGPSSPEAGTDASGSERGAERRTER